LADAAHQLRTPLASLHSLVETTLRDCRDDGIRDRLQRIDRNVRLASRIVDQFLTDAMIVNRVEQAVRERVALGPLVAEVVNEFSSTADARVIRLFVEERGAGLEVEGDPFALAEALRNLIDNAVKYAPADKPIDVFVDADDHGFASICVADRGRGVARQDLERVVRRFERSADGQTIGLGLGLSIVTRVADAHGGFFRLSPRAGGGLTATLTIPCLIVKGSANGTA
jgi:two-component system sensor histidine kinase TctE